MSKTKKIIYWVSTAWLALAMLASGVQQVLHTKAFVDIMVPLGYPLYLLTLLGIWKLLGVAALLVPGYVLVKEWTYAGFFFVMSGALFSHVAADHSVKGIITAVVLLIVIVLSWYCRPANRKLVLANQ